MNKLQLISKYRSHLMGISILWIMLFHAQIDFGNQLINRLATIGYGGVDLFLFLSGFGLYYSSRKMQSVTKFYRSRLIRILPTYLFIMLLIDLITLNWNLSDYIIKATTIGYWLPFADLPFFTWYIPAILALYLIFPFYIKWFDKSPISATFTAVSLGFVLSAIYTYVFTVYYPHEKNSLMLFTARIPVFFIGVYFGRLSLKLSYSQIKIIIFLLATIIGMGLLYYFVSHCDYWTLRNKGLFYYPFIIITPGLCLFLAKLFSILPPFINRCFIFTGSISLEIYLIHEALFQYHHSITEIFQISPVYVMIMLMIASIGIAYLISLVMKLSVSLIKKRIQRNYPRQEM